MSRAEDIIIKKAMKYVWQNPRKDKNVIVQMTRVSPRNGYNKYGKVAWDTVETPTLEGDYHFYQLGDNYPGDFTLIAKKNQWYRLSEWCNVINLNIHLYDKYGRQWPLDDVYQIRLYNDNIIIAVRINDNIFDLNDTTVYMHFYFNYFYTTNKKDAEKNQIEYHALRENKDGETRNFINIINSIDQRAKMKARLTYNGYLVNKINTDDTKIGDSSEIHYDMSIYKLVDIPINELRTYKSDLDKKNKYLIHPPKDGRQCIVYRDDIDIYICKRDKTNGSIKGCYYHRNMEDSVRMVTHRDYGLPVPYVMSYVEHLDPNPNLDDFFIRIYIKENGAYNELIEDSNMIKTLYNLSDDKIIETLTKVNGTIPEWQAGNLEKSAYTGLMRSYLREITVPLVIDAFGYTATIKALSNPNIKLTKNPNGNYFELQEGLYESVTVYEYNENGLLLGWYYQSGLKKYYPNNKDCVYIEAIAGEGQDNLNIHIGNKPFDLLPNTAYRFYLAKTEGEDVVGQWDDATADKRILVDIPNKRCTFGHLDVGELGIAIGDDKFLCYEQLIDGSDGIYDFKLTYEKERVKPLVIPPGKIDIWLNGHALVENIDYFINFPNVMIVCKRYTQDKARQTVLVRCTGFPFRTKNGLKRLQPREVGFVQYGKVSVDNHYDLHQDRILRTVIGGGVYDPDTVPFDENGSVDISKSVQDGSPYSVETPYVSLKGSLGVDVYLAQLKDYDLNLRISDYLATTMPKKERPIPPVIKDKYEVYSPFLSKVAHDLKFGRLKSPLPKVSLQTVDDIIKKYKSYLPLDPCVRGFDDRFINVHGHNQINYMELSARDIAFLERLNEIYLRRKVDVSKFFKVRNSK